MQKIDFFRTSLEHEEHHESQIMKQVTPYSPKYDKI